MKDVIDFDFVREKFNVDYGKRDNIFFNDSAVLDKRSVDTDSDKICTIPKGSANKHPSVWSAIFKFYNILRYINASNMCVLDLGCSSSFARRLINFGSFVGGIKYIGVDENMDKIRKYTEEFSKHSNQGATYFSCDMSYGLGFIKDNSIDVVISIARTNNPQLLQEIHRVLKKDGVAIISNENYTDKKWFASYSNADSVHEKFLKTLRRNRFRVVDMYGNISHSIALRKILKENKGEYSEAITIIYERLCEIMGHQIPTQIIGQLVIPACGVVIYVLRKRKDK